MRIQGDELFRLTEESVKGIRYIKLNKKASYLEEELHNITYNKVMSDKNEEMQFYALGFYDSLICMKPKQLTSTSHKEHFLISYPFEKTANTLNAEQWFGILPLSEPKRYWAGIASDNPQEPIFCGNDLQWELPYMGVVLLSLGSNVKGRQVDFKSLLAEFANKCSDVLSNFSQFTQSENKYISELYYSLNCADLCLVIRTDALSFIHGVNYYLNVMAGNNGYNINSTVIFAIQYHDDKNIYKRLIAKNDKVFFIVRSNEKYKYNHKGTHKERSRGVNGVGRYVTRLTYEEYIEFLPQLILYKFGEADVGDKNPLVKYVQSICHEREWFSEEEYQNYPEDSFAAVGGREKLQDAICSWIREVRDMIIKIEEFADNLFRYVRGFYKYRETFIREIRLIKDLVYAYSDLWYQDSSENGFVFFIQLMTALQGVDTLLQEISMIPSNNKMLEQSVEQLFEVMHWIACDLNGYNKQFQFLNQDSVNFPNYEIQSKVNAEKYMAAYCSFLHKFFVLYYQEKKDTQMVVQNLPLALVDLNQRKIVTNIFFSALYRKNTKPENRKVRGIFAVHFPSSEYFSDLWNSLPLLMHEASHTHNYGEVIDRNKAVVFHIDSFFSQIIAREMLKIVNDGMMISTSVPLLEILKEKIFRVIRAQRGKAFREMGGFENWGFQELRVNCEEFYNSIFDKRINVKSFSYNQFLGMKEKIKKDVGNIMRIIGFHEMCYAFSKDVSSLPAVCYFINVLYLEFNPEFYLDNEVVYDNQFLADLKREVNGKEKEEVEQEILLLALYRYLKYVKCDDAEMADDVKSVASMQKDFFAIVFTVVQLAAMRAIFEKYRYRFQEEVSEYSYCDQLLPNITSKNFPDFSDMLTDAYGRFITKQEDRKKPSMHDCGLMESMFCEYYEIHLSINNVVRFLLLKLSMEANFSESIDTGKSADMFVEEIHRECRNYIYEEEHKKGFKAIFTKSNREQLMRLGFFEEEATILKKVFVSIFMGCGDEFVTDNIFDRMQLFKEVYADCGMCCAMKFDSFGYCMFALSIHNIVNDRSAVTRTANFLSDRIRAVVGMFFSVTEKAGWPDKLERFLQKLCDKDMVMAICRMLQAIYNEKEVDEIYHRVQEDGFRVSVEWENDEAEIFCKDYKETLLRWRDDIIGRLIYVIELKYENEVIADVIKRDKLIIAKTYLFHVNNIMKLFAAEDILPHIPNDMFDGFFQRIQGLMMKGKGIIAVRNNSCVREISRFYNMDCPENVTDKFEWYYSVYVKGFITQCNFIFDNYCEYRNAYNNIKRSVDVGEDGEVSLKINQWFEVIDDYYRREGNADGFEIS